VNGRKNFFFLPFFCCLFVSYSLSGVYRLCEGDARSTARPSPLTLPLSLPNKFGVLIFFIFPIVVRLIRKRGLVVFFVKRDFLTRNLFVFWGV
jgi:hypothetical protein